MCLSSVGNCETQKESLFQMCSNHRFFQLVALITSLLFFNATVFAQSENPGWVDELTLQLLMEYQCELAEYEALHVGKLGGRNSYTAKAVCADGRKYDATRIGDDDDFNIRLCEVVRC